MQNFHVLIAAASPMQPPFFECPMGYFPPPVPPISLPLPPPIPVSNLEMRVVLKLLINLIL